MMMNFLDLSAASEEECRLIREILSDTSVVNIADPIESKLNNTTAAISSPATATTTTNTIAATATVTNSINTSSSSPPSSKPSQQPQQNSYVAANGRNNNSKQAYRNNSSANNSVGTSNYSNASSPPQGHPNYNQTIIPAVVQPTANQNYNRNSYTGQRKNAHNNTNTNNISGNIGNNNSSNTSSSSSSGNSSANRNRISSMSNVSSSQQNNINNNDNSNNVQPIYSQQFTTQLPSNVIPTTLYHNMNVNMNSHSSSTAINNSHQQQQQHQRANEHGNNDRLRTMGNHMHTNNIVSSNSSVMPNIGLNMDQHHSNTMPQLNMYQHATHMHHQVPPVMQTPKVDAKNGGNKNPNYHVQDGPNNMQTTPPNSQPSAPPGQMPQMAGDMNTVIGMDMTAHPQGYAIQAFGPPHPHQMFSGPPIFQPHPYSYLIPYNLPQYMPYVPMPSNTVPPRPQVAPQTNQTTTSSVTTTTSHSRPSQPIHLNNEHYDPSLTSNRNNLQQSMLDRSQAADHDRSQGHAPSEVKSPSKLNLSSDIILPSPRPDAGDHNSTEKPDSLHELSADEHLENKKDEARDSTKIGPLSSKEILTTKGDKNDHHSLNSNQDLYEPTTNGQSNIESTQQGDAKDAAQLSASSASDDHKEPRSTIDHSSPEVSRKDPSNRSTNELTKKSQPVDGCNKSPTDQVTSDPHDSKNIEAIHSSAASSKSWADLFKRKESQEARLSALSEWVEKSDEDGNAQKSTRKNDPIINPLTSVASTKEQRSQDMAKRALDKTAPRIANKVNTINLKHALPFLKPRGFINKGNGCYINATLQALIACPPFYNLMKEIGDLRAFRRENSCTPILDSFAELFLHFPPLDSGKKAKQSGSAEPKPNISSLQAEAIEPKCIYNVLGNIKSECLRGAQEDAEEFLSSVLNGLHEEMISLREVLHESNDQNNQQSDVEDSNDDNTNDDNLWREVGSKNRSLPIRIAKVVNTPIQEIFGGSLFSIRTAGKDRCGHRSPFFDLQLDISDDNVKSVQDAIKSFTSPEIIHDFYCSKTKQKLDAQRKTSLDQLPPILILHLKQFIYTQDCGLKKLMKKIEYPIDFELPESCLHEKNSTDKNLLTSRSYKLLAVVYHDGKEAVKGHYLTDVYHIGSSQWIRCDDSNLKAISSPRIENPDAPRTPYLLFYRRLNTLRAQTNNHDNKKKN